MIGMKMGSEGENDERERESERSEIENEEKRIMGLANTLGKIN